MKSSFDSSNILFRTIPHGSSGSLRIYFHKKYITSVLLLSLLARVKNDDGSLSQESPNEKWTLIQEVFMRTKIMNKSLHKKILREKYWVVEFLSKNIYDKMTSKGKACHSIRSETTENKYGNKENYHIINGKTRNNIWLTQKNIPL